MCSFVAHNAFAVSRHDLAQRGIGRKPLPLVQKGKGKMINGFVGREEFHKLTEAEARAFLLFLTMEAERHREDILTIESDILEVKRIHRNV